MVAPIVQVHFVDLETKTNVYPGVTATLRDMRTKMRITLDQSVSDPSHIQNATATIALRDGSDRAKSYELSIGQNEITQGVEGDMKHPFEINKQYSVRIILELSDKASNESSVYVGEFTYGDNENEPSYDRFIYRDPSNLDEFSQTECKLVDHKYFEEGGSIKIDCPIDFKEPSIDTRKPVSLRFVFDEVDNYPGTENDSDNTEHKKAYINLTYEEDGRYEFEETDMKGGLENDRVYHILVTAKYADGYYIQKTLNDNAHLIVNPVIIVEPYGLGHDDTGAGDLNTSTAAVLHVQKDTIGVSESNIPAKDEFMLKIFQNEVPMYTANLYVSDGVTTIRVIDEVAKDFLTYTLLSGDLNKVGTPVAEDDGTHNFAAQIFASYDTLPGTSIASLEKPSNVVSGTYVNDYTPLTQVNVANAWMVATNVGFNGPSGIGLNRQLDMDDAITINGYTVAPDIGIVGSFYKTAHFGSGVTDGLLKDLDVATTMFKYEMSVTNGDEVDNWQLVKKIHQIQGTVGKTSQENYIDVINASEQANDDGEYPNIPYTGTAGTSGPAQPAIYFRICETVLSDVVFSEDQIVKVRVTIVTPDKSTDVGSKESNMSVVVKKINRYTMTVRTASEPLFTGSGAEGVLAIPINAEGLGADLNFASARFESNLDGDNADITQTDHDDDAEGGHDDDQFNLIVVNPSKRGVGVANAINYTVTYKINDPNGGTVSIKSESYAINVIDDPTTANFAVTNYSYHTFKNNSESSFTFNVSFTGGIDGVNVYFQSTNDDNNASNDIARLLVLNVPRASGNSQSNLLVMLTNTSAQSSGATSGITVNDIDGNDSTTTWLNYRSGTISFVPYKSLRVFGSIIDGDDDIIENNDSVDTKRILNIPVKIEMPDNVVLVGGVVESHKGTKLTWSDNSWEYSNTSVTPSYDLVDNGVNNSGEVVVVPDDSSKLSYAVNTNYPAPYTFNFVLRIKLASVDDNTVYYSEPVTVEFTSAAVDMSGATALVKRGSNVTTLKALIGQFERTDASNLNVTEFKLVDAGSDANVCIATQVGVKTVPTDAQLDGVIADSSRSMITTAAEVDGWSVKNTYADGAPRPKVNLYYYINAAVVSVSPPAPNGDGLNASNSFTLNHANGLGLYAIFYQNQGAKEYPFFNAYTARTSSGTNKSWYKSKVFYGPKSDHGDTTTDSDKAGLTLVYTGIDDGSLFPEITRRVEYEVKVGSNLTNANTGYENEPIWLLSLQTSGAATSSSESFNFRLLETGMFTSHNSFGQLSLRYNVVSDPDPESPAVNVLSSSTINPVQAVNTVHTYNLSQGGYEKSDTLKLVPRMKAGVTYTEKRGTTAVIEDKDSQPTYLSLVDGAKTLYTCAGKPSVNVVGTSSIHSGDNPDRRAVKLTIDANGLSREGIQSVNFILFKEGDLTDPEAAADGTDISVSFESTSAGLRSYTVSGDATLSLTDNLMPDETQELVLDDEGPVGSYILELGTLDENDESVLFLPGGSVLETGDITVLAVVSTRVGTDVDYNTVTHPDSPDPLLSATTFQNNSGSIEFVLTHSGQSWSPLNNDLVLKWDINNGGGFVNVDYSVTKLTETTYKFSFIGHSNYAIKVELSKDGIILFDNWLSPPPS